MHSAMSAVVPPYWQSVTLLVRASSQISASSEVKVRLMASNTSSRGLGRFSAPKTAGSLFRTSPR